MTILPPTLTLPIGTYAFLCPQRVTGLVGMNWGGGWCLPAGHKGEAVWEVCRHACRYVCGWREKGEECEMHNEHLPEIISGCLRSCHLGGILIRQSWQRVRIQNSCQLLCIKKRKGKDANAN